MALPDTSEAWIPVDSFGTRLAIVRQCLGGWNVKRAAEHCGVEDASWRNWEAGRSKPRDYLAICRRIADGTGVDYVWLALGGPLNSARYSRLNLVFGNRSWAA